MNHSMKQTVLCYSDMILSNLGQVLLLRTLQFCLKKDIMVNWIKNLAKV